MHTVRPANSGYAGLGRLGEVIQWGPLGPGGDPRASLQTVTPGVLVSGMGQTRPPVRQRRRRTMGEVIQWGPLGPGGDPAMSLQTVTPGVPVRGLGARARRRKRGLFGLGARPAVLPSSAARKIRRRGDLMGLGYLSEVDSEGNEIIIPADDLTGEAGVSAQTGFEASASIATVGALAVGLGIGVLIGVNLK